MSFVFDLIGPTYRASFIAFRNSVIFSEFDHTIVITYIRRRITL